MTEPTKPYDVIEDLGHCPECGATKPAQQQEPVGCEGAVVNGRVYADRLERDYKFECEAGPLYLCNDWVEFRRCFEWLAQHTSPQPSKPLTEGLDVKRLNHCMIAVRDWLGEGCDTNDIPRPEIAALVAFTDYGIKGDA